jgi:uncharacterized protein YjiS (DUF1127 family)
LKILTNFCEAVRRQRNTQETIKELNKLTNKELKDIGISRNEINHVARNLIEFHRAVRDQNE